MLITADVKLCCFPLINTCQNRSGHLILIVLQTIGAICAVNVLHEVPPPYRSTQVPNWSICCCEKLSHICCCLGCVMEKLQEKTQHLLLQIFSGVKLRFIRCAVMLIPVFFYICLFLTQRKIQSLAKHFSLNVKFSCS